MANQANLYPDGYNNVSTKAALDWYKANHSGLMSVPLQQLDQIWTVLCLNSHLSTDPAMVGCQGRVVEPPPF